MNQPVKVYGHRRSGNNLLCSLIYYNFFPDQDMNSKVDPNPNKLCTLPSGEKSRFSPWGKLFGSHDVNPDHVDLDRAIYVYRNPQTTADSYLAFMETLGQTQPINREMLVRNIRAHHKKWRDKCYWVFYYDMVHFPERVLEDIGKMFGLERVPYNWWLPKRKIGWNPRGD